MWRSKSRGPVNMRINGAIFIFKGEKKLGLEVEHEK